MKSLESALSIVTQANERMGPITVLVTSTAGSFNPTLVRNIPVADLPHILSQQALAPIVMSGAVLPTMIEQGEGVILNIASDAAKVPTPGEAVIGAAMAAIVLFTRTLAMEAKRHGIRVNALTPSLIENLEDELGGAVGQREVAELINDDQLGAGIAADDASELAARLGLLEFVGEPGERGEPDAPSLVAGADRQRGRQHRLAGAAVADEDDALAVVDPEPSASAAIVACGTL